MLESLKKILVIQELDIKMIRLMNLKKERQLELKNISSLRGELQEQLENKEKEIEELKKEVRVQESALEEAKDKVKKFEAQQGRVKKVEEFNALSQEISHAERERNNIESKCSDGLDKIANEEEGLESIKESIRATDESSQVFEEELNESISRINDEGRELLEKRTAEVKDADKDVLVIYEKLLANKKDRVVVPIQNRVCSGCHIVLTAQHENLVRKGERLIFCEHCSRALYWPESDTLEGTEVATKKRRRRSTALA